jgi:choline dehydrogenase-like flavoprotein
MQSLSKGRRRRLFIAHAVARYVIRRFPAYVRAFFRNYQTRQKQFISEDEWTMDMMCAVAMGRDKSVGRFRLGSGWRETSLRLERTDGRDFYKDPIYAEINATLARFARELSDDPEARFENPFLGPAAQLVGGRSITLTHPLGGCVMAESAEQGVVDGLGRVFDTRTGDVHPGLYVADGSAIPTALGVNPSLTISAVALRTAHHILDEIRAADGAPSREETAAAGRPLPDAPRR